ncbi:14 kDa phosphohistidine phosphatase-like [Hetaerina americana]|uniref:14 kDa phosphohistidine phosphatase-like n=1 Tax=Hetaerina americana TaxID=62018 RepID=UPI003A7F1070
MVCFQLAGRVFKAKSITLVRAMAGGCTKLASVPDVELDSEGKFKYVLINVHSPGKDGKEESKKIVRGFKWAPYHSDIYDDTTAKLAQLGLDTECLGGGRIIHDPDKKTISVFGYSQGFGKADHEVSVSLIKRVYPEYQVTWSDEGY